MVLVFGMLITRYFFYNRNIAKRLDSDSSLKYYARRFFVGFVYLAIIQGIVVLSGYGVTLFDIRL